MAFSTRGRLATENPVISNIRELTRGDLTHLTTPRSPTSIQSLRDNHHRIARALASGMTNLEVAFTCGVSAQRISQLNQDPAMQELVSHYRAMVTADWVNQDHVNNYLSSIRNRSLAQIEDKLELAETTGESLPSRDLAMFAELGLDRTGYGKVNKNLNVNVDYAAKLETARERRAAMLEGRAIEAPTPLSQAPQSVVDQSPAGPSDPPPPTPDPKD